MICELVLLVALGTHVPAPETGALPSAPDRAMKRDFRRRTLTIDDANVSSLPEIHVSAGIASVLSFQVPLKEGGAFMADVKGVMNPISQSERFLVLVPKRDLSAPLPLNVSLADGTVLTFKLVTAPRDADAQVDVVVDLRRNAAPESLAALRSSLLALRDRLDQCQAGSAAAGAARIASLLIEEEPDAPHAFEHHALHAADKQSRLLVEARSVYRLLGVTYLVLTVENRDPLRSWTLDRAEVKTPGASPLEVKVLATQAELGTLPPDSLEKVVVAFATPAQAVPRTVRLFLFERDGFRHVSLDDLEL